jgi:RHS repeat-associated protein
MRKLIVLSVALTFVIVGHGQLVNKPDGRSQVPGPSLPPVSTPAGNVNGSSDANVNYIRERATMGRITDLGQFAAAGFQDVKQTTQYFDGLSRPLQTVQRQATSGSNPVDIVSPVLFDVLGREVYKYLPYASTGSDGQIKLDPFNEQKNFYQNIYPSEQPAYTGEQVFYGQTNYEPSPLDRVTKALAPGNSWTGSGNGISQQYLNNGDADSVVIWNISSDPLTYSNNDIVTNIPGSANYYPAGTLFKNVMIDEQSHAVVEYKDKAGLVILKKVQIDAVAADFSGYNGWLCTYYVYDDLAQLRFVLSPKATRAVYQNSWNLSADATIINELCFRYEYDDRKRMTAKKVPGAGWTYMVYDVRDRLVFTQDANMRSHYQWLASLYEALNRPVLTGMINYSGSLSDLQAYVNNVTGSGSTSDISVSGAGTGTLPAELDLNDPGANGDFQATTAIVMEAEFETADNADFTAEIVDGSSAGTPSSTQVTIVDNPLPLNNNFVALTMTMYDDYSKVTDKQYTSIYNSRLDAGSNLHAESLPGNSVQQAIPTHGLVTSSRVRVLEDPSDLSKGQWLTTAIFYDDRARAIQAQSDNYRGGHDTLTNLFDFTGQVLTSYLAHSNPMASVNGNTRVKTNNVYDESDRLVQVYKTINDADSTRRLLAQYTYDRLGQMKQKQLGQLADNSFLETQDYAYNIRGWLKGINRDYTNNDNSHGGHDRWFGMDLSYDWGFGANQLNGNIAGNKWRSKGDGKQRAYGFGYDDANRLLFADFNQFASDWDKTAGVDFSSTMGDGLNAGSAYDENGNIKGMKQLAWQLGGSKTIDDLHYTYGASSNKLQNVIDGQNDPTTTLGDFRTSALSPYNNSKTNSAIDYNYDVNGNLTRDLNKDIGSQTTDGIIYNHLNLPWRITVRSATGTKGTITYIYDAAGNKLQKNTLDNAGGLQTMTSYIGAFQYQGKKALGNPPADTLQFFGHEEGKVRVTTDTTGGQLITGFKYDYFLKDHLGNTRMVLTDEQEVDRYPAATMEVGDSATENLYYTNLDTYRTPLPSGYPTDTTTNPNNYVAGLSSADGSQKIGPAIVLKVMAGDKFSIRASSWYSLNAATPQTPVSPLTDIVTALISGVGVLPGGGHPLPSTLQTNSSFLSGNVNTFLTTRTDTAGAGTGKPHAFVNWILFDNQFNYVESSSGYSQVGADQELHPHILTDLPVTSSGYLYIYTSNQTPNVEVFFDNLQVTHTRGPLLEEDHYYPFGLSMAGISDKAMKIGYRENKYRYNGGNELQNKEFSDGSGLEAYDANHRMLDHQIGKFMQLDALASLDYNYSPYAYANDDPSTFNDPTGLTISDSAHPQVLQEATVTAQKPLDVKNGQVLPLRNAFWDVWEGHRSFKAYFPGTRIVANYAVDSKGYIIPGASVPNELVFDLPVGDKPLSLKSLRSIFNLKNFIKSEYDIYTGFKEGILYIGKAKNGINARYSMTEIAEYSIEAIEGLEGIKIDNATALGIEQLIIDLNSGEKPLEGLSNIKPATVKQIYIEAGRFWLDTNMPDWETALKLQ